VVDSSAGSSSDYYQTQYDLHKSRSLARKTLDALKLWDDMPPKNAPRSFGLTSAVSGAVSWVGGLFKNDVPSGSGSQLAGQAETLKQSRAIDALLRMLTVSPVKNSRIVNLTARSFDPQLATAIVNAHARGFIEQNTEFKFQSSLEATAWLNERSSEQRTQVAAAERALQDYRERHSAISPEDSQNITVQKLSQLNAAYTTAKMARLDKEVVYNQLKAIGTDEAALDAFPAVLANSTIQLQKAELATLRRNEEELLQTLDVNHPRAKAIRASIESTQSKIRSEIQNVVKAVQTGFEASEAQEKNLGAALQAQKSEVLTMSQDSIQFGTLKRDVDSTRQIYDNLLQRARETGISTALRTTNVRIVDPAEVPRSPASPNRPLNLMAGVFGGLLLGVVLGFFFEYLDNRIKTPDEIKAYLGVPALGLLPVVRGLAAGQPYPILNGSAWPKLNEAFRTLRTNVIFSSAEQGCRSIVVTSTGPNEGKTLVSANFAISLAEAGLRVLLLDADMRRPKLHDVFQIEQEPGLSNLVVGGTKASDAIKKTSIQGLWVLPAGRIPPNPAELLGSSRFLEFLKSFSTHFDWVVIDTPPVMAVADAAVVAHSVTGVLFVVRSEMVGRHAAQTALEQLDNTRANIVGAVLNRVDLDRHAYYYSQYYRKEYSEYYSSAPKA
jgi:capsular exopolysaccharide synthesis family protein